MKNILHIGFKGKHNASSIVAKSISKESYLLTNSFEGLKRDIESLNGPFDYVVLFGADKNLRDRVRIERAAEKETREFSSLDLYAMSVQLDTAGIPNCISEQPTHYLCNDAYWHLLQKFNRKAVLIHIPSIKNISDPLIERLSLVFS